jgi:hypothetical protein
VNGYHLKAEPGCELHAEMAQTADAQVDAGVGQDEDLVVAVVGVADGGAVC